MARFGNAPEPDAPLKFGDLIKDTLALKPLSEGVSHSEQYGESEYTDCRVLKIDAADGTWESLGTMWVFASRVRGQLRKADENGGWIAGVLGKSGQAYQLDPVPKANIGMVEAAIEAWEKIDTMGDELAV